MTWMNDREWLGRLCGAVPLFPLPGVVFLPHTLLPLHVFEPRYRALVEDVLEGPGLVAIPCLAAGWEEDYEGEPELISVCGIGRVVRHQGLPDGRWNIIVLGLGRLELSGDELGSRGYRIGRGDLREDRPIPGGEVALRRTVDALQLTAARLVARHPDLSAPLEKLMKSEGGALEFMDKVAHLVLRSPLERQQYLELDSVEERSDLLLASMVEMQG